MKASYVIYKDGKNIIKAYAYSKNSAVHVQTFIEADITDLQIGETIKRLNFWIVMVKN